MEWLSELLNNPALGDLHFVRPLWLLALLPALLMVFGFIRNVQQRSDWQQVIDPALLKDLLDHQEQQQNQRRQTLPILLLALAYVLTIVALAGPSWERLPQATEQTESTLIVIADMTLSMHATDVKPSRLVRARYKLLELFQRRTEGQTALIVYSGDAHVVSPLTDDAATIAALVPPLSPEIMPAIGSNARAAFDQANALIVNAQTSNASIVWLTDEVRSSESEAIIDRVHKHGSELLIIGIGTVNGSPVPLPSGKFLKDGNNIVNATLSRSRLQQLASRVGGKYVDLRADNSDIEYVIDRALSNKTQLQKAPTTGSSTNDSGSKPGSEVLYDSWQDRGAWLTLLIIPLVLGAFRRGWVLNLAMSFIVLSTMEPQALLAQTKNTLPYSGSYPTTTPEAANTSVVNNAEKKDTAAQEHTAANPQSFGWQDLWQTDDQQAQALMEQARYPEAAKRFEQAEWRGVADYLAGNYNAASEHFSAAAEQQRKRQTQDNLTATETLHLAKQHYNRGHALAHSGELEAAISAYDQALTLQPKLDDAQTAKDIVESMLQQQQQQNNESSNSDSSSDDAENQSSQAPSSQANDGENQEQQSQDAQDSGQSSEQSQQKSQQQSQEQSQEQSQQQSQQNSQEDSEQESADRFTASEEFDADDASAFNEKDETENESDQQAEKAQIEQAQKAAEEEQAQQQAQQQAMA